MAFIAGVACVAIVPHIVMLFIRIGAAVLMAVNASKLLKVVCVGMAIGTMVPFVAVASAVYRKPGSIMIEIDVIPTVGVVA